MQLSLFREVLCAIDASQGSVTAVEQAIALSGEQTVVTFLAVYAVPGSRHSPDHLCEERAESALARAAEQASRAGIACRRTLVPGATPTKAILALAVGHDLLVVGAHGEGEVERAALGRTATTVAHRPEHAVLIARRHPSYRQFPHNLLLASDGSASSWEAAGAAGRLGGETHSSVRMVHVPDGEPEHYRQVLEQRDLIAGQVGWAPEVLRKPGAVPERICQAADADHSSLVVMGRRGTGRAKSLGSVSEMVVHRARCSVLVVPPNRLAPSV